jgi:hypothetical protein
MLRRIVSGVTVGAAVCAVLGLVDGCLTRPVVSANPVTKTNFITSIPQGSIDKVDLLFDIDNSASMGDKQAYLAQAVPDLISRLVTPNCIGADGMTITGSSDISGNCGDPASTPEFPAVHNLHIGLLSSSLGARLGDACPEAANNPASQQMLAGGGSIDRHNDDQAHLINRGADPNNLTNYTETPVGAATSPDNFLDWFPMTEANAGATPTGPQPVIDPVALQSDFQQMVVGVHQFGCGIESQLETWYRFLIQPDPYATLGTKTIGSNTVAEWNGVDTTILQQRADFLRPDSLVAILVLTDENDSEVDVRSFGGTGYNFMSTGFYPPRGTSACQSGNPAQINSAACTSCGFNKNGGDSSCTAGTMKGKYSDPTDWGFDLNLRHVHEKQKYGVTVQFPIQRYVVGLTSPVVPDRNGEYPPNPANDGSYASSYQGLVAANQKCTNPLFAASLPTSGGSANWNPTSDELCNLPVGTRGPGLIYYAHIGGVPHQLLQTNPSDPNSTQKETLTSDDWTLILGNNGADMNNPETYDYTGIDPHMVESYQSRTGVAVPPNGFKVSDPTTAEGTDPIAGREWITDSTTPEHSGLLVDREYACIFKLTDNKGNPAPRQCDMAATTSDPTLLDSCDCTPPSSGGTTFSQSQLPAVCNDQKQTQQDYAKAYPTIRELEVARLLGTIPGANEGIISSLCPIHTYDQSSDGKSDPLYGYRPAMNTIIDRLKQSLQHQCLPQKLSIDPASMQVPCLVLGTFPAGAGYHACTDVPSGGYKDPDPTVLQHFHADQHGQWVQAGSHGTDPSTLLTCELDQLAPNVDCSVKSGSTANDVGWCYLDSGVKGCGQAILFSPSALQGGVTTSLQCIEASSNVLEGGASTAPPANTGDDASASGD